MISPDAALERLVSMANDVRRHVTENRQSPEELAGVERSDEADTIYGIDAVVEPAIEAACVAWGKATPLILIAEGVLDENGEEGERVFPAGTSKEEAQIRVIIDPIDGTRGLMYDKRPAFFLAAVAPNEGPGTKLSDCFASVMAELPTTKMGFADTLVATRGGGATCRRTDLRTGDVETMSLQPSRATTINHGFAQISNFFPGTKVLASELMEHVVRATIGEADVTRATVFDDQYISTGGQWYELCCGRDRFNADLRPRFYAKQGQPEGLCCHPYDCAGLLVAQECGIVITDDQGQPLDGPLDLTTGINWIGYANPTLRETIEPLVLSFLE
jgi:fructose-1,6-bisphosphatase/inositol monophosphatase family enzyme